MAAGTASSIIRHPLLGHSHTRADKYLNQDDDRGLLSAVLMVLTPALNKLSGFYTTL